MPDRSIVRCSFFSFLLSFSFSLFLALALHDLRSRAHPLAALARLVALAEIILVVCPVVDQNIPREGSGVVSSCVGENR